MKAATNQAPEGFPSGVAVSGGFLHLVGLRLQAVEIFGGALCMGGGAEDGALVLLQHLEPVVDIGGMLITGFWRQAEVGAKERRAKLGDLS